MRNQLDGAHRPSRAWVVGVAPIIILGASIILLAKEKKPVVSAEDASRRLFDLLDSQYGGKLKDFYLLSDVFKDPDNPSAELQHVLRVDYDKDKLFGKLRIVVRSVKKPTEEQLKTYSAQALFDFGEYDLDKFVKSEPGGFGKPGDVYLHARPGYPLAEESITDDVRNTYDWYITKYILPGVEKK